MIKLLINEYNVTPALLLVVKQAKLTWDESEHTTQVTSGTRRNQRAGTAMLCEKLKIAHLGWSA